MYKSGYNFVAGIVFIREQMETMLSSFRTEREKWLKLF